jgi:3-isopropylmalate/(R)-2-methylmalate dehydratase large subunit
MVLRLNRVWCHEITTPNAIIDAKSRGCNVVFDPNSIFAMIDHVSPAKDTASAIQGKIIREWSMDHGIEFLEVGRNGVCHAIIPEKGWIRPGEIGVMGDSHTCTHGAFCAFAAGVGTTELENAIITGLWICPPQKVIRVNFNGELPANVYSKDLILALINKIGVKGATNAILEFGGSVIDAMTMESRMTMTNMAVEAGATSGMMPADKVTANYLHMPETKISRWNSDPDAEYAEVINIDVSNMVPVITQNYSPGDVVSVSELKGKPVDQIYIGSCTNGRIEDLRIAAGVFHNVQNYGTGNGKVAKNVRCIVVPATQHVYEMALKESLIKIFIEAGCFVSGPTCGACLGMSCGVIAPGEVCVSTTNRNFPGRMGKDGMVHLCSPATAALTAINGVITEPSETLCSGVAALYRESKFSHSSSNIIKPNWIPFASPDYNTLLSFFGASEVSNFSGKPFCLNMSNVDTDQIIPAKYLTETDKKAFGQHCLEDAMIPLIVWQRIFGSQILVAGENFGCGSSREHAPWALEAAGIRCVIAPSFARIFENNMFANGLLCVTLPKNVVDFILMHEPSQINIDWENGKVKWGSDHCWDFKLTEHQKDLIRNGGSVGVMIRLAARLQKEGKI